MEKINKAANRQTGAADADVRVGRVVGGGGVRVSGEDVHAPPRRDDRSYHSHSLRDYRSYSQVMAPEERRATLRQSESEERGMNEERNSFLEFQTLMRTQMQQIQRQIQMLLNKEERNSCALLQMKQCGCTTNHQYKINV